MIGRAYRLRLRRRIKSRRKQVAEISHDAGRGFDRLILKRLEKLVSVRRFIFTWTMLLVMAGGVTIFQTQNLSNYYEFLRPVDGGVLNEGMVGQFTTANPLFATDHADKVVAKLLFASLFKEDNQGQLTGDLAKDWQLDDSETLYTVDLRPGLKWSDGQDLTAKDVAFTYQTIQNPDVGSVLFNSWQGIKVEATGPLRVTFKLKVPLSSFIYSLTSGIVPEHILKDIPAQELRTSLFNTVETVGSGPFVLRRVEVHGDRATNREERITMAASDNYYGGRPSLEGLVLRVFANEEQMVAQFNKKTLDSMMGLAQTPTDISSKINSEVYNLPLQAAVMVFFKTSNPVLSSKNVRKALARGTDVNAILAGLGYPARPVIGPILKGQLGFDPKLTQPGFDLEDAKKILDKDGWKLGSDGFRHKQDKPLSFTLYAIDNPEFQLITRQLQSQWQQLGVKLNTYLRPSSELDPIISSHEYDALLSGISIGADPDVYAFWHSLQADVRATSRLNFSEYKSKVADEAILAGRTRLDPALRAIKYKPFLKTWAQDVPAVGLYQPRYLIISRQPIYGFSEHPINSAEDVFTDVQNWQIRQARISNND